MCTVSWIHSDTGYRLLCNRDEKRSRRRASAPEILSCGALRATAPIDTESGGTWIGANEFALTLCLLNGRVVSSATRSRGQIVPELLGCRTVAEAMEQLRNSDLRRYSGFTLIAIEPGLPASALLWDGVEIAILPDADRMLPFTSSSHDGEQVRHRRLEHFRKQVQAEEPGALDRFHASHANGPSAYSVCMHREDAETVSFTSVAVEGESVRLSYSPGSPCLCVPAVCQTLRRVDFE